MRDEDFLMLFILPCKISSKTENYVFNLNLMFHFEIVLA
jgi:hypothetical protein